MSLNDFVQYFIEGFPVGCIYGLVAIGLVLTYKTSGVFNLAFGAQAFMAAAFMYELKQTGLAHVAVLRRLGVHHLAAVRPPPRPRAVPLHAELVVGREARLVAGSVRRAPGDHQGAGERRAAAVQRPQRGQPHRDDAPRRRRRRVQDRRLRGVGRPDGDRGRDAGRGGAPRGAVPLHRARPPDAGDRGELPDGGARRGRQRAREHGRVDALELPRRSRRSAHRPRPLDRLHPLHAAPRGRGVGGGVRSPHQHPVRPPRRGDPRVSASGRSSGSATSSTGPRTSRPACGRRCRSWPSSCC